MNITEQQKEILKIILDKCANKATPSAIKQVYKEAKGTRMGNVHEQLRRMINEGLVKKISDLEYSLTEAGLNIFNKKKKEDEEISLNFTEKEIADFKEFAQNNPAEKLCDFFAPQIMGLEKEKIACLLSAISKKDAGANRNRIHILFIGDPGCGKTQLLKSAVQQLWGFFCDSNTSSAGLRGKVAGDQFKTGLLHTANHGLIAVDELDKFEYEDQEGLLTVMESGILITNKNAIHREDEIQVRVIAAANKEGQILEALKDRFDLIIHVKKLSEEQEDGLIRQKINDWDRKTDTITEEFFKKYMTYARQIDTKLPEDREWMYQHIIQERKTGRLLGKTQRQMDAIYRLMISIAKLSLKKEVDEMCLKKAIEIIT